MDDLPERLRRHCIAPEDNVYVTKYHGRPLLEEAADTIERLTRERDEARKALEWRKAPKVWSWKDA